MINLRDFIQSEYIRQTLVRFKPSISTLRNPQSFCNVQSGDAFLSAQTPEFVAYLHYLIILTNIKFKINKILD